MNSYDLVLKYSVEILQNRSAVSGYVAITGRICSQFFWCSGFSGEVEQGASLPLRMGVTIQNMGLVLHLCVGVGTTFYKISWIPHCQEL